MLPGGFLKLELEPAEEEHSVTSRHKVTSGNGPVGWKVVVAQSTQPQSG